MDSGYSEHSYDGTYSHNPRPRAGSGISTTEGLFQNLQLAETPSLESASYTSSRPPSSAGLASPVYLSPSLSHPAGYLSNSIPHQESSHQHQHRHQHQHQYQPHQHPHQHSYEEWFDPEHTSSQGTPLLRLDPAPDQNDTPTSSPPLQSIEPGSMSAVAVSYDPGFSMGSRSSFPWPVMDSNNGLLPPDMGQYGSEASLSPPGGSRSVTGSPPRNSLTPEQRELKRQRDQARHSSKLHARTRRAGSGSDSVYSPPATLADLTTGASAMPVYTTAPSQMPLMSEPSAPHYLPPFSPPLPDQSQPPMFTSPYPPQSYMADYSYQPSGPPSLPSHYGSRPVMGDPNIGMYQVPPVMGPGPQDTSGQVRVVHSRPKPQCWEHGCNGRQFSTFSNLLRHQREKSGQATKASCPNCGAEFTRTTARNGHLAHEKCKKKNTN
ncbi:hypothetical protein QBC35DRAFT_215712 [Podospora australis]|uniref:C2H2-type domain-containing protein n=1 Tax=Podospora australis TaxID=1536484 RepID=A0AAN7AJ66_9PEZI|nr:hypothetical protein QBC35DRAFT_215712 [Podospora australis]